MSNSTKRRSLLLEHGFFTSGHLILWDPFVTWMALFYPGVSDQAIVGKDADPNGDTWANALAFVLAMSPSAYHQDMLPTRILDDTYCIFEFARSDTAAYLNPSVEYCSDMSNWTRAVHGQNGVVIEVENDGFGTNAGGAGIDRITVKIPIGGMEQLFCQLVVEG